MAIGVFDSGIGGMTVVREIRKRYPDEKIIYFGDTKRVPYGGKSQEELIFLSEQIVEFLIKEGAEVIVDACNTTSALALPYLRKKFTIPIIGVLVPGAKAAACATDHKVGVIATEGTIRSNCYQEEIQIAREGVEVTAIPCPKLVGFIEDGDLGSEYVKKVLNHYLNPIFLNNCDTLVLGCTHYPFLQETIRELIGDSMTLVDPAIPTVDLLKEHLGKGDCEEICYVSGDFHDFNNTLLKLFPDHGFEKILQYDPIVERK